MMIMMMMMMMIMMMIYLFIYRQFSAGLNYVIGFIQEEERKKKWAVWSATLKSSFGIQPDLWREKKKNLLVRPQ